MRTSSIALAVAIVLALSTFVSAQEPTAVAVKRGEAPAVDAPAVVEVGDSVYAKFNYTETQGIKLDQPVSTKVLARKVNIQEGAFLWEHQDKGTTNFCAGRTTVPGLWKDDEVICFRDSNGDGRLDSIHVLGTAFGSWSAMKEPAPFHRSSQLATGDGYRYELLCEGVAAGILRLAYREFINDMARPSFTQELTYTLDANGQGAVVFRGLRISVEQATNESLRYQLRAGMREAATP